MIKDQCNSNRQLSHASGADDRKRLSCTEPKGTQTGSIDSVIQHLSSSNLDEAFDERLRQVKWSFNLNWGVVAASAGIALGGVVLLFAGKIQAGVFTTAGGSVSVVCCSKLAKNASDEFKELIEMNNEYHRT